MKRILIICFLIFLFSVNAFADETDSLYEALSDENKSFLNEMGIENASYTEVSKFKIENFFKALSEKLKEEMTLPLKSAIKIIAVSLICSLFLSFEKNETPIKKAVSLCAYCVCAVSLILPINSFIEKSTALLSSLSNFMLTAIPIYSSLLYSSGQTAFASSYAYITMLSGNIVSLISTYIVTPFLNVFLAFSIVSNLSESFPLYKICDFFSKAVKILLSFCMTVFASIIAVQSAVSSGIDAVTIKTAKFVSSSFVPAVGSAISDAMSGIFSSLKLLRSGAGAFGIIAAIVMFTPLFISYFMWKISCAFSYFACDILRMKNVSSLIKSAEKTLDIIAALQISCMAILLILSAVILSARGSS